MRRIQFKFMTTFILMLMSGNALCQQVIGIEYFFDSDPGYGNGTIVQLPPGIQIDTVLNLTTNGLQDGMHQLFIRVKDSAGHWSLNSFRPFFFLSSGYANLATVQRIEYFFDTDPGWGNGQAIVVTPDTSLDIITNIGISGLGSGLHQLNIRAQSGSGFWSLIETRPFLKGPFSVFQTPDRIVAMEYFFDQDPGFGSANSIPIAPDTSLDIMTNVDISGLGSGLHQLNIRAQSGTGFWSLVESRPFLKGPFSAFQTPDRVEAIEYFIDQDPGFGNAIPIPVTPDTSTDLIYNLDLSGFSPGFHTMMVRARSSSGFWSLVQSYPFMLFQGDTSFSQVVAAEYYFDSDPGYGNGILIPLDSAITVDTLLSISTVGLSLDTHRVFIRVKDNLNRWSLIQNFQICVPGRPVADCEIYQFGNTISFSDQSMHADRHYWDFDDGTIDTVAYPVHTFSPGSYLVRQVATNFCGEDTHFVNLSIRGIEQVNPQMGGNIGDVLVDIYGGGFDTLTSLMLIRQGFTDILPRDTVFVSDERFSVLFDLRGKAVGLWDICVIYSGLTIDTIPNGFEIVEGVFPNVTASIVGPSIIRPNRWINFSVHVGNNSNVDAVGVPLWIAIPHNADIEFGFEIKNPLVPLFDYDTLPSYFSIDTLYGEPFDADVYFLYLPYVRSNSSIEYDFKLKFSTTGSSAMAAWTHPPVFGSPLSPWLSPCLDGLVDAVSWSIQQFVPDQTSCLMALTEFHLTPMTELVFSPENIDAKWAGHFLLNFFNVWFGCIQPYLPQSKLITAMQILLELPRLAENVGNIRCCYEKCEDPNIPTVPSDTLRPAPMPPMPVLKKPVFVVNSIDPNDKLGPLGPQIEDYVNPSHYFDYTIRFENASTATASAQIVELRDTLDAGVFDLSTFSLGTIVIGDSAFRLPPKRQSWTQDIHFDSLQGHIVRMNAALDTLSGIVKWEFLTIDTATREITTFPTVGFLPPNLVPPHGEGSVSFSIQQRDSLPHGTSFRNRAEIIFDGNAPIATNMWMNKLDRLAPQTTMNPIFPIQYDSLVNLSWHSLDSGSGLAFNNLYQSINGRAFELISYFLRDTSFQFLAQPDTLYSFYCQGVDSVLNMEIKVPNAEVSFTYFDTCTFIYTLIDTTLCPGETLWGYAAAGAFIDSFPSPNACDSIRILNLSYFPIPQTPSIVQVGQDSLRCSMNGNSYQWQFNSIVLPVQTQTIFAGTSGSYSVALIDTNACTSAYSSTFPFISTPVEFSPLLETICIIPNPSDGGFMLINIPESPFPIIVSVRSVWGSEVQLVGPIMVENSHANLELSHLNSGMYLLVIERENQAIFRKVTIIK